VSSAEHLRQSHQLGAVRAGEHPPLPVNPVGPGAVEPVGLGAAPGSVLRSGARYHGAVPVTRRIDSSGRVLCNGLAEVLGWGPGLALEVGLGPGEWATFRSAGRACPGSGRRLAHIDRSGRLVVPIGVRKYLGAETGDEVVLRADTGAGALRAAHVSMLARALDLLDRIIPGRTSRAGSV
jgi:hypothetical protein